MATDLDILRALHERAPAPVAASELAERTGVPLGSIEMRLKSLVSLGYVDCVSSEGADTYALAPGAALPFAAPEDSPSSVRLVPALADAELHADVQRHGTQGPARTHRPMAPAS